MDTKPNNRRFWNMVMDDLSLEHLNEIGLTHEETLSWVVRRSLVKEPPKSIISHTADKLTKAGYLKVDDMTRRFIDDVGKTLARASREMAIGKRIQHVMSVYHGSTPITLKMLIDMLDALPKDLPVRCDLGNPSLFCSWSGNNYTLRWNSMMTPPRSVTSWTCASMPQGLTLHTRVGFSPLI